MILAYLYSFGLAVLHCFVPGMTEADPPQMVNRLARDVLGTGGRGDTEEAYPMTKSHITSGFAAAMMAVAAAALPSAPALADIQFFTGPGSVQPDENVLQIGRAHV